MQNPVSCLFLILTLLLSLFFIEPCLGFQSIEYDTINEKKSKFNLDFETLQNDKILPKGAELWGDLVYKIKVDSTNVYQGKYAVSITNEQNDPSFGAMAFHIPASYQGKILRLEGFIKTKNIDGFAGIFLRVDKNEKPIAFDNMESQNLHGTNGWAKYSISVPYSNEASDIYAGVLLAGKGKVWFDDLKLTIDGVDINTIAPIEKQPLKAELDTEFDEGSRFALNDYSKNEVKNLYELCKTWGYLKYHHSDIAKGGYNWDYELFRILPEIKSLDFNLKLDKWKNSFRNTNKESFNDHYYIGFTSGVGNPVFKNEKVYPQMNWEDDGFRLLALFRYWNMIEYFFPYKHLIDKKWDEVLREYIPKILVANDELSYKLTLLQLISEIQDSHANIWGQDSTLDRFFGINIVPVTVSFVENKLVVTKLYDKHPVASFIKKGVEIIAINNKSIDEIITETVLHYYPASNTSAQKRDIARNLLRTNEDTLQLTFRYKSETFTENFSTIGYYDFKWWENKAPSHKELYNREIGYMNPGNLKQGEIHKIMQKFMNKKGIVVDFRAYPTDFTVFSMGEYLMPKPAEFVKFTSTTIENPGTFAFGNPLAVGTENPDYYKGKIAVLINETTQSSAEYHTMALQVAPKAKVFGSQTAGADGNISHILLPGNIRTAISGIGVYYPDGTETQRIGIVPDAEVKPTIQGVREGKDEVLEAALKYINQGSND